jgi:hypothetical protein
MRTLVKIVFALAFAFFVLPLIALGVALHHSNNGINYEKVFVCGPDRPCRIDRL